MHRISIASAFDRIKDHWAPVILAELNGQQLKAVKFKGEFVWHHHEQEDELFLVVKGRFRMEFRDHAVELSEGDMIVIPRGVEHRPVADEEVQVLLFEPAGTLNTGTVRNEMTKEALDSYWTTDQGSRP
jgi:mannose-6-phosphate isomerase-like protein (cupin superfamily)